METWETCECGDKAVVSVSVAKMDGELLEQVYLCRGCLLNKKTQEALDTLNMKVDGRLL